MLFGLDPTEPPNIPSTGKGRAWQNKTVEGLIAGMKIVSSHVQCQLNQLDTGDSSAQKFPCNNV